MKPIGPGHIVEDNSPPRENHILLREDVMESILSYLSFDEATEFRVVCKAWNEGFKGNVKRMIKTVCAGDKDTDLENLDAACLTLLNRLKVMDARVKVTPPDNINDIWQYLHFTTWFHRAKVTPPDNINDFWRYLHFIHWYSRINIQQQEEIVAFRELVNNCKFLELVGPALKA